MKTKLLFLLSLAFLFVSCGCNQTNSDEAQSPTPPTLTPRGFPRDTVWCIFRHESKSDVKDVLQMKGFEIVDNFKDDAIAGVAHSSVQWVDTDWNLIICRFDSIERACAVTLFSGHKFKALGDSCKYALISRLGDRYGSPEIDKRLFTPLKQAWYFANSQDTNASIEFDISKSKTTLTVTWE